MNPIALFFLVVAVGLLPFALADLVFNGLDFIAALSLILGVAIQLRHMTRKAHR